tara:strand:- start:990 stop:1439 length:450 start_codon:yes stop_codon:yes gene_type:complete
MSEKGQELELSDEQREEVRLMLEKFGAKKEKQQQQSQAQRKDQRVVDPDPLETSPPGSTVEWHELTAKTRRYTAVRESRALFVPLILDNIVITMDELNAKVKQCGMDTTSQNDSLTVCAITQADPIRIFHIQTVPVDGGVRVDTIRYIV